MGSQRSSKKTFSHASLQFKSKTWRLKSTLNASYCNTKAPWIHHFVAAKYSLKAKLWPLAWWLSNLTALIRVWLNRVRCSSKAGAPQPFPPIELKSLWMSYQREAMQPLDWGPPTTTLTFPMLWTIFRSEKTQKTVQLMTCSTSLRTERMIFHSFWRHRMALISKTTTFNWPIKAWYSSST